MKGTDLMKVGPLLGRSTLGHHLRPLIDIDGLAASHKQGLLKHLASVEGQSTPRKSGTGGTPGVM